MTSFIFLLEKKNWMTVLLLHLLFYGGVAEAELIHAREGYNVTLSCTSTPNLTVNWEYSSNVTSKTIIAINEFAFDSNYMPLKDRLSVVYKPIEGVYMLTLLFFRGATDPGNYNCYSTNEEIKKTFDVILAEGPITATVTGYQPVFADGTRSLTLTCAATASPGVTFQWRNGGSIIEINTNTFKLSPILASDNGANITCTAMNTVYNEIHTSDSVTLIVYYGPYNALVAGTSTVYADGVNTMTFTCTAASSNPGVSFQWTKGGTIIGGNSDTFTFTPVPADDGKDVICIATNTGHQDGHAKDSVTLTVYFGPSGVTITGNVPMHADGTNTLTLMCKALQFSPGVGFQWKEKSRNITVENTDTYTKTVDYTDNGRNVSCLTWNSWYPDRTKKVTELLTVYYGAHNTEILISVLNPREGDDVSVLCTCDSNPSPSFTITGPAGEKHPQSRLNIENIFRADSGRYTCTAGNVHGTQTKAIDILVNYAPEINVTLPVAVSEGDRRVEIICEASGIPDSYNFGKWRHLGPTDYIEIRKLDGTHNGNQSLLKLEKPLTYEDSGYYECIVNNGVLDHTEELDQSYRKYLHVIGVPTFLEDDDTTYGEIGQHVKLDVSFYAVPEYTDVTWFTLSSRGQQNVVDGSLNIEQSIKQRTIDTTYYGVHVNVNGYIAALMLKNMTAENVGSYVVVVSNDKGQSSYIKSLDIKTDDTNTERVNDIPIAGAVAGSVGALLVVIAIVVAVLCRRGVITKPNSACLKDNSSIGKDVYQNQAFDPVSGGGSGTNEEVYQEIGPPENPAMHYESVTNSDIATVHRTS